MIMPTVIALLAFIGAFVGTISGFGLGTLMVPLVALMIPFDQTLLLVGIIHLVFSLWRVVLFHEGIHGSLLRYFGLPSIAGGVLGAYLIPNHGGSLYLLPILGIFLIAYALFLLFHIHFTVAMTIPNQCIGGIITGFFAGIFGIRGPIKTVFLASYNLPPAQYLATMALISLVTDIARVTSYVLRGFHLTASMTGGLLVSLPVTVVAVYAGEYVVRSIPKELFRSVVAVFLLTLGVKFVVVDGLMHWLI
jgi:uncharacterized protein